MYEKHFSFSFVSFLTILWDLENELKFYNLDDVYVTSCDVMFAIIQLFGTPAVPPRLLGQ